MTRLETAASAWGHIIAAIPEPDRGFIGAELLVVRDWGAAPATIIVPCARCHRPGGAERAAHGRLRAAGYRVVLVRSVAELDMALGRYRSQRARQAAVRADRVAAAMWALGAPVRRAA